MQITDVRYRRLYSTYYKLYETANVSLKEIKCMQKRFRRVLGLKRLLKNRNTSIKRFNKPILARYGPNAKKMINGGNYVRSPTDGGGALK